MFLREFDLQKFKKLKICFGLIKVLVNLYMTLKILKVHDIRHLKLPWICEMIRFFILKNLCI